MKSSLNENTDQQSRSQKSSDPEETTFETDSGIPVKRSYGPTDLSRYVELGEAGEFPFTRGIYPKMFREKLWTMRQYTGFGSAQDTNRRFKYLLKEGETGLSVAFDLPTQLGLDSDDPRSEDEVGKVGVAISSSENMNSLFRDIPLAKVSTSMTINATASTMLSYYILAADAQGVNRSLLRGTTQNDILKEYAARNTYIYPPDRSFDLSVDIIVFCAREMPKWHPISISGYHMREAGANAVQELAFTFANAIEYVNAVVARGYQVDYFCKQLSFFFACRNDFFEEVAKFRAARRIWAKIVRDRFGSKDEDSMKLKFHIQTSGESLTAQQPENNVIRVSMQALAAVLGGPQSLHTNSKDEALGLPTEEAVTTALRTQHIIAEESGVTRTVDPLAGSFYLENLTDELESRAMDELSRVEKLGGALAAIKSGFMQSEIQKSAYKFQKEADAGRRSIVGVNKYKVENERLAISIQKIPEKSVNDQVESLKKFRKNRDNSRLEKALTSLEEIAGKSVQDRTVDLMSTILEAAKVKATTGEISTSLRRAYGEYRPVFSP